MPANAETGECLKSRIRVEDGCRVTVYNVYEFAVQSEQQFLPGNCGVLPAVKFVPPEGCKAGDDLFLNLVPDCCLSSQLNRCRVQHSAERPL